MSWKRFQLEPIYCMRADGRTDRQTDKHVEASSHFSRFGERV